MTNRIDQKSGRITLHSVAAATGVSKSTVSRILNNTPPHSDPETTERVKRIANELGYIRDFSAANLRRGSTGTIGLVVTRLTDPVMAVFYEEVAKACGLTGRFVIVAGTTDEPDSDWKAAESLLARGVDGLILTTARRNGDLADRLSALGVRFTLALRTDGRSASAIGHDELGGYLATRHLIDLGHRRIAMISGPDSSSTAHGRLIGYKKALREAGLPLTPEWIVPSSFGFGSGEDAATALMLAAEKPTAIFVVNDAIAIGALSALTRMGLKVPDDMSLIGYSDIPVVQHLTVPLTTMHMPYDRIAAKAVELLGHPQKKPAVHLYDPVLVERASTAPPKEKVSKSRSR